ncbi:hypothetical protein AN219_37585 [Streptomyces nanshensis]|nr:hypothetical protein AN219_37585 [Streptomyces nanshensis]
MTVSLAKNTGDRVPPLSKRERVLLGAVAVLAVAVGALGLASSFDAVADAAARWGFGQPWMLPVGVDVSIPVFTAANLLLIRVDMPLSWVRFVPWALTLVTCWLNIAAGDTLSAKLAHGTMPLLWVVLSEIAAHVYGTRIGAVTGSRMERIRRSRWFLAFPSTFALWRRMVLWEIVSYRDALNRERERKLARADLREAHGRGWRRKAPRRTAVLLKLGELAPQDALPASPDQDTPAATSEPERAPEPSRTPRQRRAPRAKGTAKRSPRLPFDQQLAKARQLTAGWSEQELKAEPIRQAVGCGQQRSRQLRDALKSDRANGPDDLAA